MALRSRLNGQLCALQKPAPLYKLGDIMTKNWEWAWLTELDDDLEEAVRLVENKSINII
jgi:salicylate hydroxylase